MFLDMQQLAPEQTASFAAATEPWIFTLLSRGEYQGWLVAQDGLIVAGAGLHLGVIGPVPGCPRIGRNGHIGNVYTLPPYRRRGLARLLMERIVHWSIRDGIDQLTLDASAQAQPLYESLGFVGTSIMNKALSTQVLPNSAP